MYTRRRESVAMTSQINQIPRNPTVISMVEASNISVKVEDDSLTHFRALIKQRERSVMEYFNTHVLFSGMDASRVADPSEQVNET